MHKATGLESPTSAGMVRNTLKGMRRTLGTAATHGLTETLRRSKTDQDGAGGKIGIPCGTNPETCPVRTVQAWLADTGHSLRAGHATSAAIAGATERSIQKQTGHKSVKMLRRYIRDGSLFRENSAGQLGL